MQYTVMSVPRFDNIDYDTNFDNYSFKEILSLCYTDSIFVFILICLLRLNSWSYYCAYIEINIFFHWLYHYDHTDFFHYTCTNCSITVCLYWFYYCYYYHTYFIVMFYTFSDFIIMFMLIYSVCEYYCNHYANHNHNFNNKTDDTNILFQNEALNCIKNIKYIYFVVDYFRQWNSYIYNKLTRWSCCCKIIDN